jgi:Ca-activated chloride channel family protein
MLHRQHRSRIAPTALASMLLAAASLAAPARAADPPALMIVFDGSGSMWGKLAGERETKFATAREALREPLGRIAASTRIALASFGHRRRSDCSDVEVMLPPETGDVDRILGPLEKLNPKGKGPLVAALKEAASALAGAPGRRSLLLIHDDPDNCQQDPCAATEEIQKAQPGLVVHVVSIALRKDDAQRMSCIAKLTGGRHFEAPDGMALTANIAEVLRLSDAVPQVTKSATVQKPGPTPRLAAGSRIVAAPPTDGPPGLRLTAMLGSSTEPLEAPVHWRIVRSRQDRSVALAETTGGIAEVALAPGTYHVEASHGLVSASANVEVKAKGLTPLSVAFDAGALRLRTLLARDGQSSTTAVTTITESGPGKSKTVWIGREGDGEIVLPVGTYRVSSEDGLARAERTVTVAAGSRAEVDLVAGAGRLRVMVLDREGGRPIEGVVLQVSEDDPDAARGRREVARSVASEAAFLLPAGTYQIVARQGAAELRDRVVIRAGEEARRALVLNAGRIVVETRLPGQRPTALDGITHHVTRLDGEEREVARAAGANVAFDLHAGRYRIESQVGALNAASRREVEVRAGATQTLAVELRTGQVRLKLAESVGGAYGDVAWHIRDARGGTVWRTVQPEPRAQLAPGRYSVVAETRDRRIERVIEVGNGESRVVEISAD